MALAGCASEESDAPEEGQAGGSTDTPTDEQAETATAEGTPTPTEVDAVTILEHEWTVINDYESENVQDDYGVVGRGRNNTDKDLSIFLTVRFYDADDVQLDDFTWSGDVRGGKEFKFEAPYLQDNPGDVENYDISWEAHDT